MNDWWGEVKGTPEAAFSTGFKLIPDNLFVLAELTKAEFFESKDGRDPIYSLTWKICDGEYKNRLVFQKIKAFDGDVIKAKTAKEMLMLIFKLFGAPAPKDAPTNSDFYPMIGKLAMIKVGAWKIDDKEGNFVREVHPSDMQTSRISPISIPSALNHLDRVGKEVVEDDIPFK